jgi:hypothetical protein
MRKNALSKEKHLLPTIQEVLSEDDDMVKEESNGVEEMN